jgi:HK97 family phage portal protein
MSVWSRIRGAFGAQKDVAPVGAELWDAFEGWGLSLAGVNVNSYSALTHVAVMACTAILSEDVAKLPVTVYRKTKGGGREPFPGHPLSKLLLRPNAWQTRFEFIEMMQAALVLRGNAYAVMLRDERGAVQQMVPVHPDQVTIYEAPDGQWFYFITRRGLHEMAVLRDEPLMIHSDNVFHLRWMASWNSLLGLSRIQLMREAIGLSMSQEQMSSRVAGSGARPSGILTTENKLGKEARENLALAWQQAQGGMRNAGKTAVLEQGLKWQAMGMTLVDAEFMASRQFSLEDICRGFRVPKYKLGIGADGPGSSLVQQDQDYLNNVLSSYCERWVAKLEREFGIDGAEFFVDFDYSHFLKADITSRLNALRTGVLSMIYTPNEAREAENLGPIDGGDTLYQPTNVTPIGWVAPVSGLKPTGPGSDVTGAPATGGDGDPAGPPGSDAPSV